MTMKKLLAAVLAALMLCSVAVAEGSAFEDQVAAMVEGLNQNLSVESRYATAAFRRMEPTEDGGVMLWSADANTALLVSPEDDGEEIGTVILYCKRVEALEAAMKDVAFLAYWFGSRDSVMGAESWADEWYPRLCQAFDDAETMSTEPCDLAAFQLVGMMLVDDEGPCLVLMIDVA